MSVDTHSSGCRSMRQFQAPLLGELACNMNETAIMLFH